MLLIQKKSSTHANKTKTNISTSRLVSLPHQMSSCCSLTPKDPHNTWRDYIPSLTPRVFPQHPFPTPQHLSHYHWYRSMDSKQTRASDHHSQATVQCSNKWSTVFALLLHMQHQSSIISLLLMRLSIVKIFPRVVVQEKNATLLGTFASYIFLQGKHSPLVPL